MTYDPTATQAATATGQEAMEDYRRLMHDYLDIGTVVVRLAQFKAEAPDATIDTIKACATAYVDIARSVRSSIVMACKVAEPVTARAAAPRRAAARARVIRAVEDVIEVKAADPAEAESLQVELLDRMDAPALEYGIETRPCEEIVTDICRDLGLGDCPAGVVKWKRRTPEAVAALDALAAAPSGLRARDAAARVRVVRPQVRVMAPDWDTPDPDKPLSQWSDEELDRACLRNPDR